MITQSKIRQLQRILVSLAIILTMVAVTSVRAAQNADSNSAINCIDAGPYCGLDCVYVASKLNGVNVHFEDLLKERYVGSLKKGSSVTELFTCARDLGMSASIFEELDLHTLRAIKFPTILHVKQNPGDREYDHYILYVGEQGGLARVFDPASNIHTISYNALAPIWDGVGIELGSPSTQLPDEALTSRAIAIATVVVIAVICLWLRQKFSKRVAATNIPSWRNTGIGFAVLVFAASTGAVAYNLSEGGMFRNMGAIRDIMFAHRASFLPKVTYAEVAGAVHRQVILIDARRPDDFDFGHIPGARNIPATDTNDEVLKSMGNVSKDSSIIVYCQNSNCPFSDVLASMLLDNGFKNVRIFRGGWEEWNSKAVPHDSSN